jgi:hypothetical protein
MSDAAYYAQREQVERAFAERAASREVRNIHLKLAAKYAVLAQREAA